MFSSFCSKMEDSSTQTSVPLNVVENVCRIASRRQRQIKSKYQELCYWLRSYTHKASPFVGQMVQVRIIVQYVTCRTYKRQNWTWSTNQAFKWQWNFFDDPTEWEMLQRRMYECKAVCALPGPDQLECRCRGRMPSALDRPRANLFDYRESTTTSRGWLMSELRYPWP